MPGPATNPTLADALIRSRGAIVKGPYDPPDLDAGFPGSIDDPAALGKWEPLIRFNVSMLELSSNLLFEKTANGARLSHVQRVPSLLKPAEGTYQAQPIVEMVRPSKPFFEAQLKLLFAYAKEREDRASEIISQLAPQTPFWSAVANLQPNRTKFTFELIEVALAFASIAAMRFKQALNCPRPVAYSSKVQPLVPTPEHSSLPSGHATEAFMVAHLLRSLIATGRAPANGEAVFNLLNPLAGRIAVNRTVAGLHFPVDSVAGQILGATMGGYLVYVCTGGKLPGESAAGWRDRTFEPGSDLGKDFNWRDHLPTGGALHTLGAVNPMLRWLWEQASAEWKA